MFSGFTSAEFLETFSVHTRRVYGLRSSSIESFVDADNKIDRSFLDNDQFSLNDKSSLFQGTLEAAVEVYSGYLC